MAFTDQKLFQAFATSRIQPRLHLVADVGYEKNKYDKNGYDVSAKGLFVKAGTLYMLSPILKINKTDFMPAERLQHLFISRK
jgi:hypothetical protein